MDKIKEILKDIVAPFKNREPSCERLYGGRIDQAHSTILKAFEEMLPKEEKKEDFCQCGFENQGLVKIKDGFSVCIECEKQQGEKTWNACLAEIKEKLKKGE